MLADRILPPLARPVAGMKSMPMRGLGVRRSRRRRGAQDRRAPRAARRGCPRSCRGRRRIVARSSASSASKCAACEGTARPACRARPARSRPPSRRRRPRGDARVALVAAGDRVHGVEDRDVHDRHRPARAAGAELLAEDARVAGRHRRVIEAAGVDRDLVPVMHGVLGRQGRRQADARAPRSGAG